MLVCQPVSHTCLLAGGDVSAWLHTASDLESGASKGGRYTGVCVVLSRLERRCLAASRAYCGGRPALQRLGQLIFAARLAIADYKQH